MLAILHEYEQKIKLQESDALLKAIINNTRHMFIMIYRDYSILSISKMATEYYKELFQRKVKPGDNMLELIYQGHQDSFKRNFKEALNGNTTQVNNNLQTVKKELFFTFNYEPVIENDGRIEKVVLSIIDITEQKKVEQEEFESSSKYKLLAQSNYELVCIHYPDGNYKYVSPSVKYLLGYDPLDLEGTSPYEIFHPSDRDKIMLEAHKIALEGEDLNKPIDYRIRKKNGQYIWFRSFTEVILDDNGEVESLITRSRDITEEILSNNRLQRNERLLYASGEMVKVGVWEYDVETDEVYWSDLLKELHEVALDYNPSVQRGINYYQGESKSIIEEVFKNALEKGEPYDVDLRVRTAKNNEIWVRTIGIPEFKNGKCVRVYGTFQNITKQKSIELDLLDKEVELLQLNSTKDRMLSVISHDLRSPLNTLIGLNHLMEVGIKDEDIESIKKYNKMISQLLDTSVALLNDLVSWSKSQLGVSKPNLEICHLSELVNNTVAIVKPAAKNKDIIIKYNTENDLNLTADKIMVETVLRNVLLKALKFSKRNTDVEIKAKEESDKVFISIKDQGIGMSDEMISIYSDWIRLLLNQVLKRSLELVWD